MANNYLLFSELIPCRNKKERDWLFDELNKEDNHDDGPCCQWRQEKEGGKPHIWVWSEESFDPDRVVDLVCRFQKKFKVDEPWSATWAHTCSKPRLQEFGGGGAVCRRGKAYWVDAHSWCATKIKELEAS